MNYSREIRYLLDWAKGKPGKPYRIQLEPTFKCNLKCVYCGRHDKKFDYESELPTEKWLEIVHDAAKIGFKSVILSGEGDVIATPEKTFEIVKEIKKRGMEGSMITNATLFTPNMIEEIVKIGWDDMVISVDAPDETHDLLAGVPGSFEKLLKNLRIFKYWKDKLGKEKPDICFITVITNKNYKKFDKILDLAYEVGCKKVTFMPLFNSLNIPSHKNLVLNEKDFEDLKNILLNKVKPLSEKYEIATNLEHIIERKEEIIKEFVFKKIPEHKETFAEEYTCSTTPKIYDEDTRVDFNRKYKPERADVKPSEERDNYITHKNWDLLPWEPCYQPWLTMTIDASGLVRPCCFLHHNPDSIRGTRTLKDVWNGPIFNDLRDKIIRYGSVKGCHGCAEPVILRNKELRRELENLKLYPLKFKVKE